MEKNLTGAEQSNQAAATLAESEARFRAVWEFAVDAMVLSDPDGTVIAANPAYCELYGYAPEELVGHDFAVIFPDDQRAWARQAYHEMFADPTIAPAVESVVQRKDGSVRTVEVRYTFLMEGGRRTAMLSQIRDITERNGARARLEAERARIATILDLTAEGIYGVDLAGNCTFVNTAVVGLLGYEAAEVLGRNLHELLHARQPDGRPYPAGGCPIERALHERTPSFGLDETLWTKAGAPLPVLYSCAPIFEDGQVQGAVVTIVDISALRRAAEERTVLLAQEHEARVQAERALRALDELLSVVSHDLRNPLATIKAVTQLLQRRLAHGDPPAPDDLHDKLATVAAATTRLEAFIRDLSTTRGLQPGSPLSIAPAPVDLAAIARRVVRAHAHRAPRHHLAVAAEGGALVGMWDAQRLEQVLDNLISNAVKYSPAGGAITVSVAREAPGGADAAPWAVLRVHDQGLGIPAADLPHIFEWYRRGANVRADIAGTGVGLAGAREIVELHGGQISVASQEGAGAVFTVRLPLAPDPPAPPAP